MSRLKMRVDKLATRTLDGPDRIDTIINTIVYPGHVGREPDVFSCGEYGLVSQSGEAKDKFIARVRKVAGDNMVWIVADCRELAAKSKRPGPDRCQKLHVYPIDGD